MTTFFGYALSAWNLTDSTVIQSAWPEWVPRIHVQLFCPPSPLPFAFLCLFFPLNIDLHHFYGQLQIASQGWRKKKFPTKSFITEGKQTIHTFTSDLRKSACYPGYNSNFYLGVTNCMRKTASNLLSKISNVCTHLFHEFLSACLYCIGDFRAWESPLTLPALFIGPFEHVERFRNLKFVVKIITYFQSAVLSSSEGTAAIHLAFK